MVYCHDSALLIFRSVLAAKQPAAAFTGNRDILFRTGYYPRLAAATTLAVAAAGS